MLIGHTQPMQNSYDTLLKNKMLEQDFRFYEENKAVSLILVYILDTDEIREYFIKSKIEFFVYFGLLPFIAIAFMLVFIRKFISIPLEKLRQFAYYHSNVPEAFLVSELESIRYSMVETFTRLEVEKKELYLMARTDVLSGLANRNALNEFLERLIATSKRTQKEFAFLFLDLDHFKSVNDSLGHNIGDELLQNLASNIQLMLRPSDFVARVGGDEFVIIIQDYTTYLELSNIITRIQNHIKRPWLIQTHPININSSVGVAFYPKDGEDSVTLMKNADIAMYEAKKLGRAQYYFFTEELNKSVQESIALDKNMRQALKNREYELYYQPKVDIATGKITGAEALIRWISPRNGFIGPDLFIPLAEENGFIMQLGDWVIDEAIAQYLLWKQQDIDICISINISAKQLNELNFADTFIEKLRIHAINPQKIDIEITEYMFINYSQETLDTLNKIKEYGVSISLDDFGTGYSSLSYLKIFPIDTLKIDKSFVDDYQSEDGATFLQTIVKMGQILRLNTIAEGVETQEQLEYLASLGCDQYQGYYFSKPLSAEKFEEFYLQSNKI
jgi:diguanylate cyclase (GGDEF)-like protein